MFYSLENDVPIEADPIEEDIYGIPQNVGQRLSITDDLTSAQKEARKDEERYNRLLIIISL